MAKILIMAPHPDDELIGCFRIINRLGIGDELVLNYMEDVDRSRYLAAEVMAGQLANRTEAKVTVWKNPAWGGIQYDDFDQVHVPDPCFDYHPAHKRIGWGVASVLMRERRPVGVYSTNMNVPYLVELPEEEQSTKRALLNRYYPAQADLWENDHRYFLFEGNATWNAV